MSDHLPDVNETVPYRVGEWWYSSRHEQDYPIYERRKGSPKAEPAVIADVNELAKGHKFFDFVQGPVSDDGNLILFATDITGNRQYVLQVQDLGTGKCCWTIRIERVDSFAWMGRRQQDDLLREGR